MTPSSVRAECARGWLALGIVLLLVADRAASAAGLQVLCRTCGDRMLHGRFVLVGLASWTAVLLLHRRLPARGSALLLGALAGAHMALAGYLVAVPRWCTTCALACVLALLALLTFARDRRAWPVAVAGTLAALGLGHVVLARVGVS